MFSVSFMSLRPPAKISSTWRRLQGVRLNESTGLAFHRHSLIVQELSGCLLLWSWCKTLCRLLLLRRQSAALRFASSFQPSLFALVPVVPALKPRAPFSRQTKVPYRHKHRLVCSPQRQVSGSYITAGHVKPSKHIWTMNSRPLSKLFYRHLFYLALV